jgi:hypothetical protein
METRQYCQGWARVDEGEAHTYCWPHLTYLAVTMQTFSVFRTINALQLMQASGVAATHMLDLYRDAFVTPRKLLSVGTGSSSSTGQGVIPAGDDASTKSDMADEDAGGTDDCVASSFDDQAEADGCESSTLVQLLDVAYSWRKPGAAATTELRRAQSLANTIDKQKGAEDADNSTATAERDQDAVADIDDGVSESICKAQGVT